MTNLLQETIKVIEDCGHTTHDVKWVGSRDGVFAIDWEKFCELANFEYDSGYGGQEIANDLVVVGEDWWLERHDYDGSEWWEHKKIPQIQSATIPISKLIGDNGWSSLKEIYEE